MGYTLIKGSKVITGDVNSPVPIYENGCVIICDDKILEVGDYQELKAKYQNVTEIGGDDFWVIPGFVNAHYHCQALFQVRNGIPEAPLEPWLLRCYSSKIGSKTPELPYLEALYSCGTLLKSGITSTIDLYYGAAKGRYLNTEDALQGYIQSGIRVNFAPVARDESTSYVYAQDEDWVKTLPEHLQKELAKKDRGLQPVDSKTYFEAWENIYQDFNGTNGRVRIMLAPDAAQWTTKDMLLQIKNYAERYQTNIQTHCLETKYQLFYGKHHFGKSLVEYFADIGFLGQEVSFGHGVWLTEKDMEICAKYGTSISHNPGANLRLFSGIAPLRDYLAAGINMGIGTDNLSFDNENGYLNELRLAYLLHRAPGIPPVCVSAEQLFYIATMGGAKALGLDDRVGSLTPGKKGDITLINTKRLLSPFMHPSVSPYEVLLHRGQPQDVDTVLVNGEILLENGKITAFDEAKVFADYKHYGEKAWQDETGDATITDELEFYAHEFFKTLEFNIAKNYQYNTK